MKKLILTCLFLTACAASAFPATAAPLPDNADWMVYLDVRKFKDTQLHKCLMEDDRAGELKEGMNEVKKEIGLDPMKDIHDVILYGRGTSEENALVCITGNFNPGTLIALLQKEEDVKDLEYKGHTIHLIGSDRIACYAGSRVILISPDLDALTEALKLVDALNTEITSSRMLFPGQTNIPANKFFAAYARDIMGLVEKAKPSAAILKNANKAKALAEERDGLLIVEAQLTMGDGDTALKIEQMIKGILAFGSIQGESVPELKKIIKGLKVSTKDETVKVNFSYPSKELCQLLLGLDESDLDAFEPDF